jgi:hypothetical protein
MISLLQYRKPKIGDRHPHGVRVTVNPPPIRRNDDNASKIRRKISNTPLRKATLLASGKTGSTRSDHKQTPLNPKIKEPISRSNNLDFVIAFHYSNYSEVKNFEESVLHSLTGIRLNQPPREP